MGIQIQKTLATVLATATVGFAAVSSTMALTCQLIVGGVLAFAVIGFGLLVYCRRATGVGDPQAAPDEACAAGAGALLGLLLVAYAVLFKDLGTASRIAAGAVLTISAVGVAATLWDSWRSAVAAVLATGVVAYGALFDTMGDTAQAGLGAVIGLLVMAVSRWLWRSSAVVFSVALAYAFVVYRLFFERIDEVAWRILVGAVLIFAVILVALRWWLYWQRPRARWAAGVITLLSLGLVVFTLVRGVDLLAVKQTPREQAEAPAVGFVPPEPAKPGRGFAVGMAVEVERCDEPVHVTLVAAGTAEYWHDNPRGGPFKLGIPGADLIQLRYGLSWDSLSVTNSMDAQIIRRGRWKDERVQNMTRVSGHIPPPLAGVVAPLVVAKFDAVAFDEERNWLEERGQGTCYLRLPALSGNFTAFAAEQADGHAYPEEQFPERLLRKRAWSCVPQVSERRHNRHNLEALYCPEAELVHGTVAVRVRAEDDGKSAGEVLAEESLPEPDTVVEGDPVWSCRSDPRGKEKRRSQRELTEARVGFAFSTDRLEREIAPNCSGFVAVSEADAGERRDVTLILIGIGVALGLGAFVELLMRWVEAEFPLRHRT
jgi:hypothetical protein